MAKKNKRTRGAPLTQASATSIERPVRNNLGDGKLQVVPLTEDPSMAQTDRNGRPVRKSRGKAVRRAAGFLNSSVVVVESSESDLSSSDLDISSAEKGKKRKRSRSSSPVEGPIELSSPLAGRKRARRAPSTPPPVLSPAISPLQSKASTPAATTDEPTTTTLSTKAATLGFSNTTIQLTFNVPQHYNGPFNVHLDLACFIGPAAIPGKVKARTAAKVTATATAGTKPKSSASPVKILFSSIPEVSTGFNSLPAELRNRIYRLLFVGEPFEFRTGKNFSRSAAFLRTCRRVHEEGRTVLYGENEFCLQRQHNPRGNFYDSSWKEVGYKDVRRFFEMIGPFNLSLVRSVKIDFDDGAPSTSPGSTVEQRRFLNDGHLLHALKLLGKHGELDYIKMGFYGRRYTYMADKKFLDILRAIKTNKLEFGHARFQVPGSRSDVNYFRESTSWPGKIGSAIILDLKEHMLRDPWSDPEVAELRKGMPGTPW